MHSDIQIENKYYSAIQLRSDQWNALREQLRRLASAAASKDTSKDRTKVKELFDSLATTETYWAFPGVQGFDQMRRQFEHGNFDDAAFSVERVTRALTTGAYRRRHIPLERASILKTHSF